MITKYFIIVICVWIIRTEYAEATGLSTKETRAKNCTKPGFMCDDCENSSHCIMLTDGEYYKESTTRCSSSQSCQESTGKCGTDMNYECDSNIVDFKFNCLQPGLFPHPFNCNKYFMCIKENGLLNETPIELACNNGFGYNILSTLCNKKINTDKCKMLISPCRTSSTGLIEGNPSLYYMCLKIGVGVGYVYFPHIFACPFNYVYNKTTDECVDPTPPNGLENDQCKTVGKFYDPADCKGYINCLTAGGSPLHEKCIAGLVFDDKTKKCVEFSCWKYL